MVFDDHFETTVIRNLIFNSDYAIKVIPHTKPEYFRENEEVVKQVIDFYNEYKTTPTINELKVELQRNKRVSEKRCSELFGYLSTLSPDKESNQQWLFDRTEKFYQNRAIANAVIQGAGIIESNDGNENQILDLVQNALAVSFDNNIGLDYFNDAERRYEMYHKSEDKISWGVASLDDISCGGISKKNLVCVVASTGTGKSLFLCSTAANVIRSGKNVLYISMEMSEERVAERIDANLFHLNLDTLRAMPEDQYFKRANTIKDKVKGTLIIREYPTSGANTNHFRNLLNELRLKKGFIPDLIVVDYLNICCSSRYKPGQTNSYGFIKAISEELRGLAVEYNCAVLTATQTNRQGMQNSDVEMTDISESIGTTFVLDMFLAIIRTPALDESGQVMFKQLKNRYSDLGMKPQLFLGLDRDTMRVYDLDSSVNVNNPNNYRSSTPRPEAMGNRSVNDFSKFNF